MCANRVQTLRSSAPGVLPQAGTRQPGELWLNFADFALGFIDASQAAQKLLAVRWFVPTASYAVGDFVLYASNLYRAIAPSAAGGFIAANWSKVGTAADLTAMQAYVDAADAARLPLVGGTLTGPLILAADPTAALGATTKQYVDTGIAAANANAALRVPLAGGTMTGALILSGAPTQPLQAATKAYVDSGAFLPIAGGTMLGPIVLAADPAAALQPATKQYVDGGRLGDNRLINGHFAINQRGYASGTALAAAAYGHDRWKAGTAGCTYTFTAAVPDTTITITAGTLTQVIEAGMIEGGVYTLSWTGMAQARVYQGTPTGTYAASPLTTSALPAGTNTIVEFNAGTLVRAKLELGSVATSFNRQSLTKSLADCQRYYQVYPQILAGGYNAAGATVYNTHFLSTVMRAAPTGTLSNLTSNNNISVLNFQFANANLARLSAVIGTAGYGYISVDLALSAEL